MKDTIYRQDAIDALDKEYRCTDRSDDWDGLKMAMLIIENLPSTQPDIEKICTRFKAEAIKRNVEYMKHGDRYMLGFVDGMRLARRIVDGTIDDPVYFTLSGE